ncbi:hypothetical protein FPQ18DRAFT_79106 [Pyronema domesticum]|uniref:Similar to ankyrin [Exophiala dermatitidis NIH/UT8656] acc. no. EHY59712 n=1 Tax=Pyronema omphalodes (strain CBS 100304) TaxID=1076935 RepID=U4LH49_PYROM|nr:hypothetical protein FPQ18DRAFT_79106 [Pyronema domesticum]CCX31243.1 Similar to ankyrin [Exophiala dermatitidis NIH/UT8656]; acc. no. EHY59712 [Pyronema omphalodes CBS 100304]
MDPLSLCASVAGLISLALDVTTILNGYIGSVKSAPQEASDLNIEVAALSKVLPKLNDALRTDDISESTSDNQSILCAIVDSCKGHLTSVLEHIAKLRSISKVSEVMGRMTRPLKRDECLQSVHTVHRYVQTLQVLLVNSNR